MKVVISADCHGFAGFQSDYSAPKNNRVEHEEEDTRSNSPNWANSFSVVSMFHL
jgi:hypothetical protein